MNTPDSTRRSHDDLDPDAGIERQPDESSVQHRALLLVAMQARPDQGVRAAARALTRSEASLRRWKTERAWVARMSREGPALQARAVQLYRELYAQEHGKREVSMVEANMDIPFEPHGTPPPTPRHPRDGRKNAEIGPLASDEAAELALGRKPPTRHVDADGEPDPREQTRVIIRKLQQHAALIEALLGRFFKQFRDDPERQEVKAKDLPKLMQAWREIQAALGTLQPTIAASGAVEPSVRVRQAERNGTSVVEARLLDAQEAVAILTALRTAELLTEERERAAASGQTARQLIESAEHGGQISGLVGYDSDDDDGSERADAG